MLVYEKPSWFRLVFTSRGTALAKTKWRIAVAVAWAVVTTFLLHVERWSLDLTPVPFTFVGLALSIFLGFRNNTSYDRYWEGRRLWGSIVNGTRNATRLILSTVGPTPPSPEVIEWRRRNVYRLIAWANAVRMHLRDEKDLGVFEGLLPKEEIDALARESNRPLAIMQRLSNELSAQVGNGQLDPIHRFAIEQQLSMLVDSQGGCERIRNTPIPFSYTVLLHQVVAGYCFGLPFGIAKTVGPATPFVVAFVAYAFFGLDAVGEEIEDPFGVDANDLPLLAIGRTIEINLRERLEEREIPPKIVPVDHRLS